MAMSTTSPPLRADWHSSARARWITADGFEGGRRPIAAAVDECLGLPIGRVEAAHEADLQGKPARSTAVTTSAFARAISEWLFAENRLACLSGGDEQLGVRTGGRRDDDGVDVGRSQRRLWLA